MAKTHMLRVVALSALAALMAAPASLSAAEPKEYTCSMSVDRPDADNDTTKTKGKGTRQGRTRSRTKTKTMRKSLTWPVRVSVRGKTIPKKIKLECTFMGVRNGNGTVIGSRSVDVVLDDKGHFNTEVTSPTTTLVKTKTTKTKGRRWNRSTSTSSKTEGERITGCIIQLVVNGKVERSFASDSRWSRYAREYPLDVSQVLKFH